MRSSLVIFIAGVVIGFAVWPAVRLARRAGRPVPARPPYRHAAFLRAVARAGDVPAVALGDSLTDHWRDVPDLWAATFGPGSVNLGLASDRVEQIRWRVANGELDPAAVRPRAVVILAGVNDLEQGESPAAVAEALAGLVGEVRGFHPTARIVLVGILPWPGPGAAETNALLSAIPDVRFVDASDAIAPHGVIDQAIQPDGVHLSPEGYRRLGESIHSALAE
jgi:lysophospholipase L1-like esterase